MGHRWKSNHMVAQQTVLLKILIYHFYLVRHALLLEGFEVVGFESIVVKQLGFYILDFVIRVFS